MNKEDILSKLKIHDPEQLPKLKRVIDQCNQGMKYYEVIKTDFLSPDLHGYIEGIMYHYPDLNYSLDGGYHAAEYKRLILWPDFLEAPIDNVSVVDIVYDPKFGSITHRDVLGATLGLGLKREVVGDILLEEGHVQIMTSENIAEFLNSHLIKIGRVSIHVKLDVDEMIDYEPAFKMSFTTVKSLRLDGVIASGYNISRSKAVDYIKAEKVKLNHNYILSSSKELNEGDLISVKGKGRIRLMSVNGLSKKERYKIEIKKYI